VPHGVEKAVRGELLRLARVHLEEDRGQRTPEASVASAVRTSIVCSGSGSTSLCGLWRLRTNLLEDDTELGVAVIVKDLVRAVLVHLLDGSGEPLGSSCPTRDHAIALVVARTSRLFARAACAALGCPLVSPRQEKVPQERVVHEGLDDARGETPVGCCVGRVQWWRDKDECESGARKRMKMRARAHNFLGTLATRAILVR
jgi:hypothetical protein